MSDEHFELGNPMRAEGSPLKKTNSSRGNKPVPPPPPMNGSKPVPIKSSTDTANNNDRLSTSMNKDHHSRPKSKTHHSPLKNMAADDESKDIESGDRVNSTASTGSVLSERESHKKDAEKSTKSSSSSDELVAKKASSRFKGPNPLQYGLWAHYMAIGAAALCICQGIFAIVWNDPQTYKCKIAGKLINSAFLYDSSGVCPTVYTHNGVSRDICCVASKKSSLQGFPEIGAVYIIYGILMLLYENVPYGYGLWFPNDTIFYRNRISIIGIIHIVIGAIGCYNYATVLAGVCVIFTGCAYCYAVRRNESGDGGREAARRAAEAAAKAKDKEKQDNPKTISQQISENFWFVLSWNPITFYRRIYAEDKLSSYIWIGIYIAANLVAFFYTLNFWYGLVGLQIQGLQNGTLEVQGSQLMSHVNRKIVRYGTFSAYAAWAKACGMCLNLNGALLLLPVVKIIIRNLNNWGESFASTQQQSDFFGKFFARPMTRYIPLSKNIEFHTIVAWAVFWFSWAHMIFHWMNLYYANNPTLRLFRLWRWNGTDYFTGAVVSVAMFFIYSAAPEAVKQVKYEIFFKSHHFFTLFYVGMFLHGPNFFYWTVFPVVLYILEKYLRMYRGNKPFVVVKVEWIPPVMALYFRPVFKEDFPFKEGQYLYLNCPAISPSEWHPFTISSAVDDLHNGPRICLETGEEVTEVPRPKNLPSNARWNKYCLLSQDYTNMDPNDYLDKSDTGYNDYISLHIKVLGLEGAHARTWTRKLKEYFETLSPGKKFPFYFHKRDPRGEIAIGRQFGPDGHTPILRVDGPHAAPAEHYSNYGTLMLIGAGIGLTPCVSIMQALTKYRWKKNFNPELLHFYWIVRQNEVDSFQWLIHMLTDISYELKKSKLNGQIEKRYYCEINIFITGVEKDTKEVHPLYRASKKRQHFHGSSPTFTADELYAKMLNPTVSSRDMIKKMKGTSSQAIQENRLQDVWIWNGRPMWDDIFAHMKEQRQHSDIGVCFCGAPVIGADLRAMCEKYSNIEEDCLFSLHKENF